MKVILITGASPGTGKAAVNLLASPVKTVPPKPNILNQFNKSEIPYCFTVSQYQTRFYP